MAQTLETIREDCIRFLQGMSYEVENRGAVLIGKKTLHNRIDNIIVRFLFDTPENSIPREYWEQICDEFTQAGKKIGKYLIVREGVAVTARHVSEAVKHHFTALSFHAFLTRFARLDDLREQVRQTFSKQSEARKVALKRKSPDVFVDPNVTVGPDGRLHPATRFLTEYWLGGSHGLLVLLAPPGHGKSTLSREVTSRMLSTSSIPILIPFADYRRLVTFEGLIYEFFVKHHHEALSPDALSVILKHNLATIILDGFDELCETAGISTARENLSAVYRGIGLGGKVLLTSRTAFFRSVMPNRGSEDLVWEEAHLEPFDSNQRMEYIRKRTDLSENGRAKLLELLEKISTADELASSPLVLSELCDMADEIKDISFERGIAYIFDWLMNRHCAREIERQRYDIAPAMQEEILSEIAEWCLLELSDEVGSRKAKAEYVEGIIKEQLEAKRVYDRDTIKKTVPKLLGHALLNTTPTNNATERYIRFLHHTWHDYLIARRICEYGRAGKGTRISEIISLYRVLPEYVAKFIADILDETAAKKLLSLPELRTRELFSQALRIAQEFARREKGFDDLQRKKFLMLLGIDSFAGRDIWQAQFVYLPLTGVSFKDAVIADTAFRKCDLRRADFSGSTLRRVAFDNCDLERAVFNGVKELSPQDKDRATQAGAVVDGRDHGEEHRAGLLRELVRQVLKKFRYRNSHLTETVWRRGFSPANQSRVKDVIIPTLKRHGFFELQLIAGSKETVQRVDPRMGVWIGWVEESGTEPPALLLPALDEMRKRIKFD